MFEWRVLEPQAGNRHNPHAHTVHHMSIGKSRFSVFIYMQANDAWANPAKLSVSDVISSVYNATTTSVPLRNILTTVNPTPRAAISWGEDLGNRVPSIHAGGGAVGG